MALIFTISDKRREGSFTLAYTALNVGALLGLAFGGVAVQQSLFNDFTLLVGIILLAFAIVIILKGRHLYKDVDSIKLQPIFVTVYILASVLAIYLCFKYASALQIYFTILTLRRYTDWLPDTKAKSGYKPLNNWSEFLVNEDVVGDSPQMIPQ